MTLFHFKNLELSSENKTIISHKIIPYSYMEYSGLYGIISIFLTPIIE